MGEFRERGEAITMDVCETLDLSQRTVYKMKDFLRNTGVLIEHMDKCKFIVKKDDLHPIASRSYIKLNEKYFKGEVPCKKEIFNPKIEAQAQVELDNFIDEPNCSNFFTLFNKKVKRIVNSMISQGDSSLIWGLRLLKHRCTQAFEYMMGWLDGKPIYIFKSFRMPPPGG